ncbi:hypothetical protein [Paucibacter sp. KCTC 42545]|uniref:hypothetical protein n=1 Tax=Paucibacter sp. KCTC 42545 TaxID=1768242 RepID=UPI000733B51F|nr:hypothetical protein [Paucibacter sp. KCTC 42545]ALT79166.1 hypothetical protein AT984_20205 [Paucibacter sp. KCTC 42545]
MRTDNDYEKLGRGIGLTTALALSLSLLSACSSQEWYAAGREAQRDQCNKLMDSAQRDRCLQDANMSYDRYQREKAPAPTPAK